LEEIAGHREPPLALRYWLAHSRQNTPTRMIFVADFSNNNCSN
jgi:hypothetical protein